MASIGGITCTFLRGVPPAMKEEAAITRRPGIDGYEIHLTGKGDAQGQLTASFRSSNAGCNTWVNSLQALQGTVVTVVNDHGDTFAGCYLAHVGQPTKSAAYRPGTSITTRADVQIQILRVA